MLAQSVVVRSIYMPRTRARKNASARRSMDRLPSTPERSTPGTSSVASSDEETIARKTNGIPVTITFVKALNGETLGTHRLRMYEDTSVGMLFALVRTNLEANGKPLRLSIGNQVWNDPDHVYLKVLENPAVQDALGANEGDDVELRIHVIFVAKEGLMGSESFFFERGLRTTMGRMDPARARSV